MPVVNIEGQQFKLKPDVIPEVFKAIEGMMQSAPQVEHGFSLCDTPDGIEYGTHCIGDSCAVEIKPCQNGKDIGSFHSHPVVISFSLSDYVSTAAKGLEHSQKKALMCVSLLDKGLRCKAMVKEPPKFLLKGLNQLAQLHMDNEETRAQIKPFFTPSVNISIKQLEELQFGTPWDKLSPAEKIIAVDEGGDTCAPKGNECLVGGAAMAKKSLVEVAKEYIKPPSGKYPWETKTVTKSVEMPGGGVGLEMAGMPTLKSDVTEFVAAEDIEIPDAKLLYFGEVAGYMNAFSPIILTQDKDANGKWKILDGRHRLAGLRASSYTRIPVVFSTDSCYKDAKGGGGSGGGGVIGFGGKDGCLGKHEEDEEAEEE